MAKYVPDIKTQRWVVIAPGRTDRPDTNGQTKAKEPICPFCEGNEGATPAEVYRIGSGEKDKSGWQVRVVPNKYPITDVHEVIIHSPHHEDDIEKLPLDQVIRVLTAYRDRYRAHADNGQVLIFCNHGAFAGASLTHPHSQLVVVPKQINLDALWREPVNNIVKENNHYITYCPDFSQWPFEQWIASKEASGRFGDITEDELTDLAQVLQGAIQNLAVIHADPRFSHILLDTPFGYNYYIYHGQNWFIRIIPRFIHRAGFELGTGLNVNVLDPTEAAKFLKEAKKT